MTTERVFMHKQWICMFSESRKLFSYLEKYFGSIFVVYGNVEGFKVLTSRDPKAEPHMTRIQGNMLSSTPNGLSVSASWLSLTNHKSSMGKVSSFLVRLFTMGLYCTVVEYIDFA